MQNNILIVFNSLTLYENFKNVKKKLFSKYRIED